MTSHEQGGAAAELLLPLCRTGRDDDTPLESLIFFFSSLLSLSLLLFFFFSGLYNNNNNKCCLSLSSPLSNETKFDNSILNKNFDFLFLFPLPPFFCACVCVCVCVKKRKPFGCCWASLVCFVSSWKHQDTTTSAILPVRYFVRGCACATRRCF